MKNQLRIIALFALVSLMISFTPVSATTETGLFTSDSYSQIFNVQNMNIGGSTSFPTLNIYSLNAATLNGVDYISFEITTSSLQSITDSGKGGGYTTFSSSYGDGIIGYNIISSSSPYKGYFFVQFNSPISTTGTGTISIPLTYDVSKLNSVSFNNFGHSSNAGSWTDSVGGAYMAGFYVPSQNLYMGTTNTGGAYSKLYNNIRRKFKNSYTVTLNEGTGTVTGEINRTFDGHTYPSRAYILDYNNVFLTGETAVQSTNFDFFVQTSPINIAVKDVFNSWHNASLVLGAVSKSYTVDVSPSTGPVTTNFTVTNSGTLGAVGTELNALTIICTSGMVSGSCTSNGTQPVFLKKADTYWYQGDTKLSTSFPSTFPLKFDSPGLYVVEAYYYPSNPLATASTSRDTVNVTASSQNTKLTIQVKDSASGGLISGAVIRTIDPWGVWNNQTTISGTNDIYVRSGTIIGYGATAPGYYDSSIVYSRIDTDTVKTILLRPIVTVPAGNNTLSVYVSDKKLIPLSGASVWISDGQTRTTPGSGMVSFTVLENATYKITVQKSGYQTLTGSITVAGSSNAISMELSPIYVTTRATLAPGESPTADIRTNEEKEQAATDLFFDNIEAIVGLFIVLIFVGGLKMAGKW